MRSSHGTRYVHTPDLGLVWYVDKERSSSEPATAEIGKQMGCSMGRSRNTRQIFVIPVFGALAAGCSYVPSLEQASGAGPDETKILISDVVKRVKCELADSFDDKLLDKDFLWLQNWTAKVDLTLQVNDTAGVSPSVSYTNFYHNAFNYAAGSTSLTSNVIGFVQQTFTLTGSANYSGQAQRAETVTFTLSLHEVQNWRAKEQKNLRRRYGADGAEHFCDTSERELRGQLGLKEWINSALYPVRRGELQAGIHPQSTGASKPPSPTPKTPIGALTSPQTVPPAEAKMKVDKFATDAAAAAVKAAMSQTAVTTSVANVQTAMQITIGPYFPVLTDELKQIISTNLLTLTSIQEYVKKDVDEAASANAEVQKIAKMIDMSTSDIEQKVIDDAMTEKNNAIRFADDATQQQKNAKTIEDGITGFKPNPPIDGLLHSVQFIVGYGGGITPSWSLLLWKGPGLTVPGASLSGVRTNILNIALGPTAEQNRLIQNQTINNLVAH